VLAGTSNTAGVNTTFNASAGTGTGAGGSFLFNVAGGGTTGSTQNSLATALTIAPTLVTLGAVTSTANAPQLVLAPASGNGYGLSSYYYGGGSLVFQSNNSGVTGSWAYNAAVNGYGFEAPSTAGFCISSTTNPTAAPDACLWRASAGMATLGNSSQGDFSAALKLSGLNNQGFNIAKTRVVSAATDTASATADYFLCVTYTSTGAVTETLPAGVAGQTFLIKDCGGAAATHAITITPASGNIDGASTYVLNTNYGSVAVTYANSQWSVN